MSRRAGVAALALYLLVGAFFVGRGASSWTVMPLIGTAVAAIALRRASNVLLGAVLVATIVTWVVRDRVDGGGSTGWTALGLGLGLALVAELARVAMDSASPGRPVRVDPALRRRLAVDALVAAALGGAAGAIALAATVGARPAGLAIPLGALTVPVVVAGASRLVGRDAVGRGRGGRTGRRQAPPRGRPLLGRLSRLGRLGRLGGPSGASSSRANRVTAITLLVAGLALPALAGLGSRAVWPGGGAGSDPAPSSGGPAGAGLDPIPATTRADRLPPGSTEPATPPSLTFLVLVAITGLVIAFFLSGGQPFVSADDRRPDPGPVDRVPLDEPAAPLIEVLPPSEAAAVLDDALGYLRADLEPRLAVRCAYAAVAGGLGRGELTRRPAETEVEFLTRQLAGLGAAGEALRRLTELFEVARFSERAVGDHMRAAALEAFAEVRAGLGVAS